MPCFTHALSLCSSRLLQRSSLAAAVLVAAATSAHAALDTQPPKLTSFGVSGSVDASRTGQSVAVQLGASDNLSGVYYYIIDIRSPGGTVVRQEGYNAAATKSFSSKVVVGFPRYMNIEFSEQFGRWSEPGTWSVVSVEVRDLAGNAKLYEQAELAGLGNTQFTVTNTQADGLAPTLIAGSISTPALSLSVPPAGLPAGALPLGQASVTVQDTGSPSISGVDVVSALFCKPPFAADDCADSFSLTGTTGTPAKAATAVKMSGRLVRNDGTPVSPGTYHLWTVTLQDVAGNAQAYVASQFGGTVDFSTYFGGGTTVTVNP